MTNIERIPSGYKCACCSKFIGQDLPDYWEGCPRCGCGTAEVQYIVQRVHVSRGPQPLDPDAPIDCHVAHMIRAEGDDG